MSGVIQQTTADTIQQTQPDSSVEEPKPWLCGEPFKYPLPKEKGSPWDALLGPLLEQDKAQCDSWNDEVQNLLVFAGLFSAVLTAFLIESYQTLQPDPNDRVIELLSQISAGVQGQASNTTQAQTMSGSAEPFSPTPSSIRINAFWFTSLVLSLTAVLVGIIGLQWIREHRKYSGRIEPKDKFSIVHMRTEALRKWYVGEIFSALPVLLQLSLLLFFAGLVDFVLPYGIKISLPVIMAMGIPVIFLSLTTVLPAFQAFKFVTPISDTTKVVPSQCPYKSPQSRIFRHSMVLSSTLFHICVDLSNLLHFLASVTCLPFHSGRRLCVVSPDKGVYDTVLSTWRTKNWEDYDKSWLLLRDVYAKNIFFKDEKGTLKDLQLSLSESFGSAYDAMKGLASAANDNLNTKYPLLYSFYHCVTVMSDAMVGQSGQYMWNFSPARYNSYFQNLLFEAVDSIEVQPRETFSSHMESCEVGEVHLAIMHEENCLIALSASQDALATKHRDELNIRITNSIFGQQPVATVPVKKIRTFDSTNVIDYIVPVGSIQYGLNWPFHLRWTFTSDLDFEEQSKLALPRFFEVLADPQVETELVLKSFHNEMQVNDLIKLATGYDCGDVKSMLKILSSKLAAFLEEVPGKREDLFFYCAALYAKICKERYKVSENRIMLEAIESFLPMLNAYLQKRGIPDDVARFGVPADTSDPWWDELLRPRTISDHPFSSSVPSIHIISPEDHKKEPIIQRLSRYLHCHNYKSGSSV